MIKLNNLGVRFITPLLISALFVAAPAWSSPDVKSLTSKPAGNAVKGTGKDNGQDRGQDNDAKKTGKKDGNKNAGSSVKKKAAKKAGTAAAVGVVTKKATTAIKK